MANDRMPRFEQFAQVAEGETRWGYVFLNKITEKQTKAGKPYCEFEVMEQGGNNTIALKQWDQKKEDLTIEENHIVGVVLKGKDYKGRKDYDLVRIAYPQGPTGLTTGDFIKAAPLDPNGMFDQILARVEASVAGEYEGSLAELTRTVYEANREKLMYWSAAKSVHHNYYSGLLYHTYRMVRLAEVYCLMYPSLNPEVLLAATALHDIGKLVELETNDLGVADYSRDGQLFGHLLIGIRMLDEFNRDGRYSGEMYDNLIHCIAAHHGSRDFGSIVEAHTEEASILYQIDMTDSRIEQYEAREFNMEPGTMSEESVFGLGGVKILRPTFREIKDITF